MKKTKLSKKHKKQIWHMALKNAAKQAYTEDAVNDLLRVHEKLFGRAKKAMND